jgi:hypothetical protein
MKKPTLARCGFIYIVVLLFLIQIVFGSAPRIPSPARFQNEVAWIPLVPAGEDFSAMVPAPTNLLDRAEGPNILIQADNYSLERGGELILGHHTLGGYASGFIFVIDSYKARHPERLLNRLLETGGFKGLPERDVVIDNIKGKEYRKPPTKFFSRVICLTTREHVYFLTFATREENHPFIDRFLSSFRQRQPRDKETAHNFAPETSDIKPDAVFEPGT